MNKINRTAVAVLCGLLLPALVGCRSDSRFDTYQSLRAAFADPTSEFRSAPLWVWNDRITREEITTQLTDFRDRGLGGVFIHPRPGLITPYLSEEWLSLCRFAVEKGRSLGLRIWLYDENSYPSGFAGGHVPEQLPDAARSGLRMTVYDNPPAKLASPPLVLLRQTLTGFEDMTSQMDSLPDDSSRYFGFEVVKQDPSPWFGGLTYVDIMRRQVTEKFLEVTLDAYKGAFGAEFGKTVPGVFQDEAEIAPAGGRDTVNFTPALFESFQAIWGYDLKKHLPSLFEDVWEWRRVRHNYYETLLSLFIDSWAKPYYAYCVRNRLAFTGHYWEHEWPSPRTSPDNLAMAAYAHMPGIDILMNDWSASPQAQFGNARSVREIRSAANQLGRHRTLSETYGAGGWDMTFFDQKRIADWEFALGVNFLNQHLSYVTIKGARKRDHPLSFSYHEPWWDSYRMMADYFGRLSLVLSSGEQINRVVVLEPTTSGWMHYSPARTSAELKRIGEDFQKFIHLLEAEHIEYDVVSEKTLADFSALKRGRLSVGVRDYDLLVFPPGLENLNGTTLEILKDYLFRGGHIVSWVAPPDYLDGRPTDEIRILAGGYSDRWVNSGPGSGFDKIRSYSPPALEFEVQGIDTHLFHQRRVFRDCEVVFLANSSPDLTSEGIFLVAGGAVEVWDAFTGQVGPYPFARAGGRLSIGFRLPPGASLLLCILPGSVEPQAPPSSSKEEVGSSGEMRVEREAPNVLVLDYCDLRLGEKTERNLYFYDAQLRTFRHHGLDRNPWDSAVQFRTNILDLDKFSVDSGFEASFRFKATAGDYLSSARAVVERPELFEVGVNGRTVPASPGEWWLDKAFGVYPLGGLLVPGENILTVRSRPFTIHSELEPVYLLGNFRLRSAEEGFVMSPPSALDQTPWSEQGLPFYGSSVIYRKSFEVPNRPAGTDRFAVALGNWRGSVAEVLINGKTAGHIAFPPYELDVTPMIVPGLNEIGVRVFGTLKNTLGPHHNNPPLGRAWPGSFQRGAEGGMPPGRAYSVVPYGLFTGFRLVLTSSANRHEEER